MFFVASLFSLFCVLLSLSYVGPNWMHVPITSTVILFLPVVVFTMAIHGANATMEVFTKLFTLPSQDKATELAAVARQLARFSLHFGMLGFVMGGCSYFAVEYDPTLVGPLLPKIFSPLFYGVLGYVAVFGPLADRYAFIGNQE